MTPDRLAQARALVAGWEPRCQWVYRYADGRVSRHCGRRYEDHDGSSHAYLYSPIADTDPLAYLAEALARGDALEAALTVDRVRRAIHDGCEAEWDRRMEREMEMTRNGVPGYPVLDMTLHGPDAHDEAATRVVLDLRQAIAERDA